MKGTVFGNWLPRGTQVKKNVWKHWVITIVQNKVKNGCFEEVSPMETQVSQCVSFSSMWIPILVLKKNVQPDDGLLIRSKHVAPLNTYTLSCVDLLVSYKFTSSLPDCTKLDIWKIVNETQGNAPTILQYINTQDRHFN
jgi:hypothetical protein